MSFITDTENKYTCNICSEEIDNDKIIGLKCDPTKHIFCYDCIFDWYKNMKRSMMYHSSNYNILTMCPICRKNGGKIPLYKDIKYIRGIHSTSSLNINDLKISGICGQKLKSSDDLCSTKGNKEYNGMCKKHYIMSQKICIPVNVTTVDKIKCGVKLKTKEGYCEKTGNNLYGGFCYLHRI